MSTTELGALFVIGAYFTVLGGARLRELLGLPSDMVPGPGYPPWMIEYLTALCVLVLATGVLLLVSGFAVRARPSFAKPLLVTGALGALLFTGLHGWFLVVHEQAFADGGLIWGVVHLLTLTRLDTTATAAGIAGYRMGQAFGIAVWLGCGAFLLLLAKGLRRSTGLSP